ncbi:Os01g0891033 [Oryza sativa Japonica Group]|uniref:Os01g0891033 protein n=1 Tax=Oryza sativa subsp. japonica TaxID=39947 RepID=A0A0P0VBG3_ORYSJ|nr:hypothetical protein EE612_007310 [Oryza sativa]BAS75660.1 Os01g0891033 [Oryza sativa Japonica Group]
MAHRRWHRPQVDVISQLNGDAGLNCQKRKKQPQTQSLRHVCKVIGYPSLQNLQLCGRKQSMSHFVMNNVLTCKRKASRKPEGTSSPLLAPSFSPPNLHLLDEKLKTNRTAYWIPILEQGRGKRKHRKHGEGSNEGMTRRRGAGRWRDEMA